MSIELHWLEAYATEMTISIKSILTAVVMLCFAQSVAGKGVATQDSLTQGMVKLTVKVGVTTQTEILEAFGSPNITTIDSIEQEVWVYDRHATVALDSSSGFAVGMVGTGGGSAGGLGFGKSKSRSEVSTRTMTLIIKFAKNGVVSDFKSRSSSF